MGLLISLVVCGGNDTLPDKDIVYNVKAEKPTLLKTTLLKRLLNVVKDLRNHLRKFPADFSEKVTSLQQDILKLNLSNPDVYQNILQRLNEVERETSSLFNSHVPALEEVGSTDLQKQLDEEELADFQKQLDEEDQRDEKEIAALKKQLDDEDQRDEKEIDALQKQLDDEDQEIAKLCTLTKGLTLHKSFQ